MKILEIRERPITLELAKQHLRVGSATHDDTLIAAKLDMAVAVAEDMTDRIIREKKAQFDVSIPFDAYRAALRLSNPRSRIRLHPLGERLRPDAGRRTAVLRPDRDGHGDRRLRSR